VFLFEHLRQLLQPSHALIRIQPIGRIHRRFHGVLQGIRHVVQHVLALMIATPLHRIVLPVDRIDRRPQGLAAVDHE